LHGIPMGIKDIIDVAGVKTTCHSALLKDAPPAKQDATVVSLLKGAGAVLLGKTATWDFAIGGASFDLPWPPARNPWDINCDPSGSSSGSAVAVAAGLCLGALGTDTGGSVRGPSAWTGIAGLKPTYGLVSRHGAFPLSFTQDHIGPMCWTSEDCALMMQALATHDQKDAANVKRDRVDYVSEINREIKGLRIGVVRHFYEADSPADDNVKAALSDALKLFIDAGCQVKEVALAPLVRYNDVGNIIERAEAYAIHQKWLVETPELYGVLGRNRISCGAFIPSADYINAVRWRRQLIDEALLVMNDVDVLVMPTRPTVTAPLGSFDTLTARLAYTRPFNVLGFPALSVCSGFSTDGLPLSMQIVGRPFADATVLRMGHFFECHSGTRSRRPVL
jgi:aspartyl-tRNA(Asn)/glutamyl-tRNA(Gln) amidotransferase subunit A